MPLTIPAFVQYQAALFPLRGLWNKPPAEGDQFVNAEIDWLVSPPGSAVQFSLSGNSPVALSQIVALSIDNGRNGSDVDFIFPDSGFVLTVAAHCQGVFPVFTNALMFYASSPGAVIGDTTIIQILNSLPPPIPISPTEQQNNASTPGINIANGTTAVVPAGVSGTLNLLQITAGNLAGGPGQSCEVIIQDGTGKPIWATIFTDAAANSTLAYTLPNLSVRFSNGINMLVSGVSALTGVLLCNAYYTTP